MPERHQYHHVCCHPKWSRALSQLLVHAIQTASSLDALREGLAWLCMSWFGNVAFNCSWLVNEWFGDAIPPWILSVSEPNWEINLCFGREGQWPYDQMSILQAMNAGCQAIGEMTARERYAKQGHFFLIGFQEKTSSVMLMRTCRLIIRNDISKCSLVCFFGYFYLNISFVYFCIYLFSIRSSKHGIKSDLENSDAIQ